MKITRISAWQVDLPIRGGSFTWSGGTLEAFDSTVVRIDTDEGVTGWGETCPLGSAYLPAYAEGARTGIQMMAPHLLGATPTELTPLNRRMDSILKGHPYAKSAIDVACWDILGKASGLPLCTLLGGRDGEAVTVYRAISQGSSAAMAAEVAEYRSEGYRMFQLKLGDDPDLDIERVFTVAGGLEPGEVLIADANTGWLMHEATRVARAIRPLDVYLEQPCAGYVDCLSIRRRTDLPFVLDESIDSADALLRGHVDAAMDMVNIKISKFGGLTRARLIRDMSVAMGLGTIIEDTCGGDLAMAAVTHLAHSTPEDHRFASTDLNSYVTKSYADGAPVREGGSVIASHAPGLEVEPRLEDLGEPVFVVERS